jgi:hypothetical protein
MKRTYQLRVVRSIDDAREELRRNRWAQRHPVSYIEMTTLEFQALEQRGEENDPDQTLNGRH